MRADLEVLGLLVDLKGGFLSGLFVHSLFPYKIAVYVIMKYNNNRNKINI